MNDLIELWEKPAPGKYLIAGWQQWADAGEVSSGLPQYLIEQTLAEKIGRIKPDDFYLFQMPGTHHLLRPLVRLQDGYPEEMEQRRNEFFLTSDDHDGFLIFLGEEPHLNEEEYAEAFLDALEELGIGVEYSHHEVAASQHEIDMRYTDALTMADNVMSYRLVVKEVAMSHGVYATFMPKPVFGMNGSGMHVHQSLFKGDKNVFFAKEDEYNISKEAKSYIAGLLKYAPEITAVCNQWVNSYKRLVPGYEAPVYLSWARRNRSDLIRVPEYKPGREQATRIEFRSPDPACNPYLAFSVMLAAGLEGIEKGYTPPEPVEENIYEMSEAERKERGIGTLPASLWEAITLTEKSELVRKALGDHVFDAFITNKKIEWDYYRTQVTDYEIQRYLPTL